MPAIEFDTMPDEARIWVFGASAPIEGAVRDRVLAESDRFLAGWAAHGSPLTGARTLLYDRFLVVAVDPSTVPPSGCSIDSMVRLLKGLEGELGVEMVSHGAVYARDVEGEVHRLSRAEFKAGVAEGRWTLETPVFDTTLTELAALRSGKFEIPASEGWHAFAFFRA